MSVLRGYAGQIRRSQICHPLAPLVNRELAAQAAADHPTTVELISNPSTATGLAGT